MLGCSVFLANEIDEKVEVNLKEMSQHGFKGVFTSLHIPEDDKSSYVARLKKLGELAQKLKMNVMVDISEKALEEIGFSLDNPQELKEIGITGIRMDYGIEPEKIAEVSKTMTVGLNASTLSEEFVKQLDEYDANKKNMELWHNYYPRMETGLDRKWFAQKNHWLHELNMKVIAFAPGDNQLRGPLYDTLPTLEDHRQKHPLAVAVDLLQNLEVDEVYIGDSSIHTFTMKQFSDYFAKDLVTLRARTYQPAYQQLIIGAHSNRMDDARDVIRSAEARFKKIPQIIPENTKERPTGSLTLDNEQYGRYMGEMQITKRNLPADLRVNVVGNLISKDCELLPLIEAGKKYQIIESE
ncbi:DUF871 domain-containing protein [Vagococcus entomophilus]|uniref:Uncharacterized protein n=1 Tax=Vagococcus entomophilus TaxID=1160095 RepID=A0A430AEV6_9ENTE|nr:MupG family TIM beta-alpha barrel fold protein [Vagococcus entomophilus]RSU05961.1 hypothetical protein CBF30_11665 [Vagococcus entomophilus]